jgi:hypothetical protein
MLGIPGLDRSMELSYTEPPGFQGWLVWPPRFVFGFGCSEQASPEVSFGL